VNTALVVLRLVPGMLLIGHGLQKVAPAKYSPRLLHAVGHKAIATASSNYDALAGGVQHVEADPKLAAMAHELVDSIRRDLTVDWTDRRATEAKIRTKIKRLRRRHRNELPEPATTTGNPAGGGGGSTGDQLNLLTNLILDQAKALYRYWPEVEDRLFAEV
jgi:hypothetical protein